MMTKTIAQMAILTWVDTHFETSNIYIEFTGAREASLVDSNGDTVVLKYEPDSRTVYAV